jgi:hypothetical protein
MIDSVARPASTSAVDLSELLEPESEPEPELMLAPYTIIDMTKRMNNPIKNFEGCF